MSVNFLNSIAPAIYIKRIILENTLRNNSKETNPHIDHTRESQLGFRRNAVTGKMEIPVMTPDLAKKNTESDTLLIKIDFLLKEKLDNSALATWFSNEEMMKYLKVCILQSTNEGVTNLIISKQIDVNIKDFEELNSYYRGDTELKSFMLRDVIASSIIGKQSLIGNSILEQFENYYDEDGNKIFDIDFRIEFDLKGNGNPKHLSCFAFCYVDVEQIMKDYSMDLPLENYKYLKGLQASEIIIDNYNVVSQTFLFTDLIGNIWDGDIHKNDDGKWRTGVLEDENSRDLFIKTVANTKVQDYRSLRELEKVIVDFAFIENPELLLNPIKILSNDNLDVERKINYFSNFCISRDTSNNCRFLFAIDFLRMIREKTLFGKLYKNDDPELLKNVKIRHMKIYRVRVPNDYNNSIENDEGVSFFNQDEDVPELVVCAKEEVGNMFIQSSYLNPDTKEVIGTVREIPLFLEGGNRGIRHFTGIDQGIKKVTFGFYKYLVELDIEDNTNKLLFSVIDDLIESYELLKEYYNEANTFDNFDPNTGKFKNAFVMEKESLINYLPIEEKNIRKIKIGKGRITDAIEGIDVINRVDPNTIPWIKPVNSYLTTMKLFSSNLDYERYQQLMFSMLHPRTGTTDGIETFLRLLESLIMKIGAMAETAITGRVNKGVKSASNSVVLTRGKTPIKSFSLRNYSKEVFDCDVPLRTGFDYLTSEKTFDVENDGTGLKLVSYKQYERRTELEILKYFKTIDVDINLKAQNVMYTQDDTIDNTRYGYLSPSNISLGEEKYISLLEQGENLFNMSQYGTLLSDIVRFNSLRNSPQLPLIKKESNSFGYNANTVGKFNIQELGVSKNYDDIASNFGVTLHSKNSISQEQNPYKESAIKEYKKTNEGKYDNSLLPHVSDEKLSSYLKKTDAYFGTNSPFNKQDLVSNQKEEIGLSSNSKQSLEKVAKSNSLMTMIFFPIMNKGTKTNMIFEKPKDDKDKINNSIEIYDLTSNNNCIDRIKTESLLGRQLIVSKNRFNMRNAVYKFEGKELKTNVKNIGIDQQSYVKALPNQIKSLFLASVSSDRVNKNWFSNQNTKGSMDVKNTTSISNPLKDPDNLFLFKLNYNMIKRVEVLFGYNTNEDEGSNNIIKEQLWIPLDKIKFEKSKEYNLLCRLVSYEDSELNIRTPKGLELPTYNEYFILTFGNSKVLNINLLKQLRTQLKDFASDQSFVYLGGKAFYNTQKNKSLFDLTELNKQVMIAPQIEKARSILQISSKEITEGSNSILENKKEKFNAEMQININNGKFGR